MNNRKREREREEMEYRVSFLNKIVDSVEEALCDRSSTNAIFLGYRPLCGTVVASLINREKDRTVTISVRFSFDETSHPPANRVAISVTKDGLP